MKTILKILLILILALHTGKIVYAQSDENVEYKLSASDVKKFIDTYPEIKAGFESLNIQYDAADNDLTLPESAALMDDVNKVVQKQGYIDIADYFTQAGVIVTTYAAIQLEQESNNNQAEYEEAISEIEENPYYTDEQKEQMIAILQQSYDMLSTSSETMANSHNVAVVTPFVNEIEEILNE